MTTITISHKSTHKHRKRPFERFMKKIKRKNFNTKLVLIMKNPNMIFIILKKKLFYYSSAVAYGVIKTRHTLKIIRFMHDSWKKLQLGMQLVGFKVNEKNNCMDFNKSPVSQWWAAAPLIAKCNLYIKKIHFPIDHKTITNTASVPSLPSPSPLPTPQIELEIYLWSTSKAFACDLNRLTWDDRETWLVSTSVHIL